MSNENDGLNNNETSENRGHFFADINTVFPFLGKHYFLIFYFGRHLHPRQQNQLVNQRTMGNWIVVLLMGALLFGFAYGALQVIDWRLDQSTVTPKGASTHVLPPQIKTNSMAG